MECTPVRADGGGRNHWAWAVLLSSPGGGGGSPSARVAFSAVRGEPPPKHINRDHKDQNKRSQDCQFYNRGTEQHLAFNCRVALRGHFRCLQSDDENVSDRSDEPYDQEWLGSQRTRTDGTSDGMQDLNQHEYEHQPIDDKEYRAGAAPGTHSFQQKQRCAPEREQCAPGQKHTECHIDDELDV